MNDSTRITPAFFRFLEELKRNNKREWFQANKERFQREVQQPMLQLVAALQEPLARICPALRVDPSPVGGSLFRIYRDVRFSKDQSPYKTHMAARFPLVRGRTVSPLGFYLSLGADGNYVAGGSWRPEPRELNRIRVRIAAEPAAWKKATGGTAFQREFEDHEDEMLKRVPRPYPQDHPCADDLRRKSFVVVARASNRQALRPDFAAHLARTYTAMTPMMKFLAAAMNVKW